MAYLGPHGQGRPQLKTNFMLTPEQKQAAENAAHGKAIQVRYLDVQPGFLHHKPQPLFNVVAGDYAVGSTITLKTAFRLGLRVEVVEWGGMVKSE